MKAKKPEWVPMTLEGPILNCTDLEGLIGIEELSSYDENFVLKGKKAKRKLETQEPTSPKKGKKEITSAKKQKCAKKENIPQNLEPGCFVKNPNLGSKNDSKETETTESEAKTKKKKRKKLKKAKNTKTSITPEITNGFEITEISNPQPDNTQNDKSTETNIEHLKAWDIVPLPPPILKALAELRFLKPTEIQEKTLPSAILGRRDILGAAETGSGKTLAFGLPILAGILNLKAQEGQIEQKNAKNEEDSSEDDEIENDKDEAFTKPTNPLYALILTPTRELAIQVKNHISAVAKYTGIKTAVVVGGLASEKQERLLSKGPEIVVATPGRLWELIKDGNEHLSQLDNIRFLAIDETDRMLERGHFDELHQLLERINFDNVKKQKRQNFVFSATLTIIHDLPKHLLIKKKLQGKRGAKITKLTTEQKVHKIIEMLGITEPKVFDISKEKGVADSITECKITCLIEEKDYYVYYFLKKHPGRTLIFCNSIGCVKRLATLLSLLNCQSLPIHSSMHQKQRLKNLDRFRDNENGVLIATDVAARGLDIPNIEHVIHYQTPRTVESYVHRSGRTARAENKGLTMLLIDPSEINNYKKLCLSLNRTEDLPAFPVELSGFNEVKNRVNLARKLDQLELKMKRKNSESGWLQKAAKEMDMIIDDMPDSENEEYEESVQNKRHISALRKELSTLLSKPVFPRGFSFKYPTSMPANLLKTALQNNENTEKMSAIDIVKKEIENTDKANKTKQKIKKFKTKLTVQEKKTERKAFKMAEKKQKRKNKREKLKKKHEEQSEDDDHGETSFKKSNKSHKQSSNGSEVNNFSFELC